MVIPPAWPAWDGSLAASHRDGNWRSALIAVPDSRRRFCQAACRLRCLASLFFYAGLAHRPEWIALFTRRAGLNCFDFRGLLLSFTIPRFPDLPITRSDQPLCASADLSFATRFFAIPGFAIALPFGRSFIAGDLAQAAPGEHRVIELIDIETRLHRVVFLFDQQPLCAFLARPA